MGNRRTPRRLQLVARAAASLALVLAVNSGVAADDDPPQLPDTTRSPQVVMPAAPADAVLLDRTDQTGTPASVNSQDFFGASQNDRDRQGADDFCIPGSDASWTITTVDVVGVYNNAGDNSGYKANVYFMRDNGTGLPSTGVYTKTNVVPTGGLVSGSYTIPLAPPANLAGNLCYWLSVVAVQPSGKPNGESWQWVERSLGTTDHSPSAYRKPGVAGDPCQNWGPRITLCATGVYTDFSLRLSGSISTTHLTPEIATMYPPGGLNEDVELSLTGFNFAVGAVISWTVGITNEAFAANIIDGSHLTATIPAASVGPAQALTATVRVNNPSPCLAGCASNSVTFLLQDFTFAYLPSIGR